MASCPATKTIPWVRAETRMGFLWPGVDGNLSWATFLRGTMIAPGPEQCCDHSLLTTDPHYPHNDLFTVTQSNVRLHDTLHDTLQHQSWLIIRANVYLELMMLWAERAARLEMEFLENQPPRKTQSDFDQAVKLAPQSRWHFGFKNHFYELSKKLEEVNET